MDLEQSAFDLDNQCAATAITFEQFFGECPTLGVAAPGRVNLIGEHTDYNDGFVLPLAIQRQAVLLARPRGDSQINLRSTAFPGQATLDLARPIAKGQPAWADYLRGVIAKWGYDYTLPGGFDALLDCNVPSGAGLSSSAAIEVAMARLIESLAGKTLDDLERAKMAQWAEHHYAGMPCGIMDQYASSAGKADHVMLIDCRSEQATHVPLDPRVSVLIIDSKNKHTLVDGEYASRRSQCEAAAKAMGVDALRDVDLSALKSHQQTIDPLAFRRARHVVTENQRVLAVADAMRQGDWPAAGKCMYASHASMDEDFEITTPQINLLVKLAKQIGDPGGVIGSRMTGGGFGGCTVTLVHADKVDQVAATITQQYRSETGIAATAFVTKAADGARNLEIMQ